MFILLAFIFFSCASLELRAQSLPPPPGIISDCQNERPYTLGELHDLANTSTSFEAFLENLPPGVLQTYTLMERSESNQRLGITRTTPRVIRSTSGRTPSITIAYGCNPHSPHYGQVEVIYQDPSTGREIAELLEFPNARSRRREHQTHARINLTHITANPTACIRCHTGDTGDVSLFRHNFRDYPDWLGAVGANDDSLNPREQRDYLNFRTLQSHNPCYNTLPHPRPVAGTPTTRESAIFPYTTRTKPPSLYIRPNFHLTALYSRDLGIRNFHLVFDAMPENEKLLIMALIAERHLCRSMQVQPAPELVRNFGVENLGFGNSRAYGLDHQQWGLHPPGRSSRTSYNSGLMDLGIENWFLQNIMDELARHSASTREALNALSSDSASLSYLQQNYGQEHDCIYPRAEYTSFSDPATTTRATVMQTCFAIHQQVVNLRAGTATSSNASIRSAVATPAGQSAGE